jgi:branched-chain amino acid transport system substrate-binding protein
MKRKLIGISAVIMALAMLVTLAPACGNGEEGEVKTLKIGILQPLSGPAAPWGTAFEAGAKWAIDRINAAGGIKVGNDRYMVETTSCDTKYIGSEAATCASRLLYEEDVHYVVGPISTFEAVDPIFTAGKCFYGTAATATTSPETPYRIVATAYGGYPGGWSDTTLKLDIKHNPQVKKLASLSPQLPELTEELKQEFRDAVKEYGLELVAQEYYVTATTDYYPMLTGIIAKDPDAIWLSGNPGDAALQVKQVRELGYEGQLWIVAPPPVPTLMEIAGRENVWGLVYNLSDWTSDAYSEKVHELVREWDEKYARPGEPLDRVTPMGYSTVVMYRDAIEQAGSIDPDEVMKVFDDPNFRFDAFWADDVAMGGIETYGIRRQWPLPCDYGEIIDADNINLSMDMMMTGCP